MNERFTEGPARAFRAVVPRMWPQQMPVLSYEEVPLAEVGVVKDPILTCDGCGACCLHIGVPPFDESGCEPTAETDIEYASLPTELRAEIDAAWQRGTAWFAGKPCIWFDAQTRRCKHYEHRPVVCADFVPGNPICMEDRREASRK